jgi:cyanate lyase
MGLSALGMTAPGATVVGMGSSGSSGSGSGSGELSTPAAIFILPRLWATWLLMCAKQRKGMTFSELAKAIHRSEVWTTAAILGQHPLSGSDATKLMKELGLDKTDERIGKKVHQLLQEIPYRGGGLCPLTLADPTIYRFAEMLQVYAPTFKALIHEKFGDGIMSAVSMKACLESSDSDGRTRKLTYDPSEGTGTALREEGSDSDASEGEGPAAAELEYGHGWKGDKPRFARGVDGVWGRGDDKGTCVKITLVGKFLPYKPW